MGAAGSDIGGTGCREVTENFAKGRGKQTVGQQRDLYYWFGYKLHLLVDGIYELPLSFVLTMENTLPLSYQGEKRHAIA